MYHVYAGSSDSLPRKGRGQSVCATPAINFVSLPRDYDVLVYLANVSPVSVRDKVNNMPTKKKNTTKADLLKQKLNQP